MKVDTPVTLKVFILSLEKAFKNAFKDEATAELFLKARFSASSSRTCWCAPLKRLRDSKKSQIVDQELNNLLLCLVTMSMLVTLPSADQADIISRQEALSQFTWWNKVQRIKTPFYSVGWLDFYRHSCGLAIRFIFVYWSMFRKTIFWLKQ